MLLRICLILAIVTGLGVIGVSQFVVRPHIEEIIRVRNENKDNWDRAEKELATTKKNLKSTTERLTKTEATLEETKGQLVATTQKFEAEQKKSAGLQQNLDKVRSDLKVALDDLAAWTNLGLRVEQIRDVIADRNKLQIENQGLNEQTKVFAGKVKKLEDQVASLLGKDEDPPVPRQVRGKVLVVDPKWDFLVLDVGKKQEVPERGVLLVSRNGELVAKIRVTNTQEQRSIANIMPGWKLKDVMEGDVVLPY